MWLLGGIIQIVMIGGRSPHPLTHLIPDLTGNLGILCVILGPHRKVDMTFHSYECQPSWDCGSPVSKTLSANKGKVRYKLKESL